MSKKSKNLLVVAASENYLPAINALFNSIDYHKIDTDVLLISWRLPKDYLDKIQEVFNFHIRIIESNHEHQVEGTAIERFKYAVEIGKEYDAICLMDADMFFMSNVDLYFQVASKGFIVTAKNGMIINFNEAYQKQYNVDLGTSEYPYLKIHTTAPIWLGPNDLDWFDALYQSKRIDSFDDFLYLNILGIKMGKDKRMISLEPFSTTNIHHFCLKPTTRVLKKTSPEGYFVMSGTEGEMTSMHGKLWIENYYLDLAKSMDRFFIDEELGNRQKKQMLDSRETMLEEFIKYAYLCKLDLRDFVKIDWLEKKLSNMVGFD